MLKNVAFNKSFALSAFKIQATLIAHTQLPMQLTGAPGGPSAPFLPGIPTGPCAPADPCTSTAKSSHGNFEVGSTD